MIFVVYIVVLVYFLFFSEKYGRVASDEYHYNLVPFTEIKRYFLYFDRIGFAGFMLNIVGNVVAFIPFGMFLPLLQPFHRKAIVAVADGLLFTVCIETIQLVTKVGSFDVDDIILNTLGALCGYVVFILANRIVKKEMK